MAYGSWDPYVSVAKRREKARKAMMRRSKKGETIQPVEIEGRKIARTFWGRAWCDHLEQLSDFDNRLPRGRTYVRNGSLCHLAISEGQVKAIVSGSELYNVKVKIGKLPAKKWTDIKAQCAGEIGSMLELLQGRLSDNVMTAVTHPSSGLFPLANEISFVCDCPDWASMCKHVAATLYGVGARLDNSPELLFKLRAVQVEELIATDFAIEKGKSRNRKVSGNLAELFDVDLEIEPEAAKPPKKRGQKQPTRPKASPAVPSTQKTVNSTALGLKGAITAAKVKKLRKHFGMSPLEFALLINVSQTTINAWENKQGKLNLRSQNQQRLTDMFETSSEDAWRLALHAKPAR